MTETGKTLRSPRGRAIGLGSAKYGVEHWWRQRVTAIALVILSGYLLWSFVTSVIFGNYADATDWLSSPIDATLVILFIVAGFWHAALGLQAVIEDYVHHEPLKIASLLAVNFTAAAFTVLGVISVVKVLFWSVLPHG
jgi:succinate dehydrogenase / fumarate reductase membrane anchor subunit